MEKTETTTPTKKNEDWLNSIKNKEIRVKALKNAGDCDGLEDESTSLTNALFTSFRFTESPEGFDYWDKALDKVRKQLQK